MLPNIEFVENQDFVKASFCLLKINGKIFVYQRRVVKCKYILPNYIENYFNNFYPIHTSFPSTYCLLCSMFRQTFFQRILTISEKLNSSSTPIYRNLQNLENNTILLKPVRFQEGKGTTLRLQTTLLQV